jgi:xanthine permease XanP
MFMPSSSPIVYLAPGLYAASIGGLPLMAGMMVFACLCEFFFSTIIDKIRVILPKEICGLAFLIVGIQLGIIAFYQGFDSPKLSSIFYFVTILSVIVFFNVWCKGIWKNLGSLYAVIVGVALYAFFPSIFSSAKHLAPMAGNSSVFSLPHFHNLWRSGFSFDISLIPIFFLTAFTATVRVVGVALIANTYESGSSRPDYKMYRKALRGDAISGLISSLLTGVAINVSPVTTTLTIGAKCTSKVVAIGVMVIYFAISLSPFILSYIASMPNLLISSVLMWYAILLSTSGLQIMHPEKFEIREYYSIGLPLILAMTIWVHPEIYNGLPKNIARFINNPLSPALLLAIFLTLIFYIKSKKELSLGQKTFNRKILVAEIKQVTNEKINNEVLEYIASSLKYLTDLIYKYQSRETSIDVNISVSKMAVNVMLSYHGRLVNYQNLDKDTIFDLVEDEATYIGLKEYFRNPPNEISHRVSDDNIEYKLAYFID